MAALFPMFVKLAGRKCLVVGAGTVAESKIEGLLRAGANVHVIAPDATPAIAALASAGKITWEPRTFAPSDVEGMFLVVAATSLPEANQTIYRRAEDARVLCNAVDRPELCHFYYPAVVRRGDLQIAISTGGKSPSLAHRLRVELEAQFGPEYEAWLEWLGAARKTVIAQQADPEKRKRLLASLASRQMFDRFTPCGARRKGRAI
jgi:precorrin-2 dehydrogenase/sirohydrochlorin ferrochelatase